LAALAMVLFSKQARGSSTGAKGSGTTEPIGY